MRGLDRVRDLWQRRGPWGVLAQTALWPLRRTLKLRIDLEFEGEPETMRAVLARRPMRAPLRVRVVAKDEIDAAIDAGLRINPHSRMRPGRDINFVVVAETAASEIVGVWAFHLAGGHLHDRSCMVVATWRGQGVTHGLMTAALNACDCRQVSAACELGNRSAERMLRSTGLRQVAVRGTMRAPGAQARSWRWPTR